MPNYKLSFLAELDLFDIAESTIEDWGLKQAKKYALSIDVVLKKLTQHPELGLRRSELYKNARSFPIEKHIIYYCYVDGTVEVARILHQKMDPTVHF